MLRCFGDLIERTVEAYVDDIVVKSKRADHLVADLEQTFAKLWVNGIKANLEKISAITRMGPIQNIKGVQRITGCLAALSRFISRLGECDLPLYRLLKKVDHFEWTSEA